MLALDEALVALAVPGVRETVPTYRSLMIHYDPLVIDRQALIDTVGRIEAAPGKPRKPKKGEEVILCHINPTGNFLTGGPHGAPTASETTAMAAAISRVRACTTGTSLKSTASSSSWPRPGRENTCSASSVEANR